MVIYRAYVPQNKYFHHTKLKSWGGGTDNTFGTQVVMELYSKSSRCFFLGHNNFVRTLRCTWNIRTDISLHIPRPELGLITIALPSLQIFTLEQQVTSRSWSKGGACAYYEGYACRKLKHWHCVVAVYKSTDPVSLCCYSI